MPTDPNFYFHVTGNTSIFLFGLRITTLAHKNKDFYIFVLSTLMPKRQKTQHPWIRYIRNDLLIITGPIMLY